MPSTAPSWRKQEEIADPVAKRAGGSSATAAALRATRRRRGPRRDLRVRASGRRGARPRAARRVGVEAGNCPAATPVRRWRRRRRARASRSPERRSPPARHRPTRPTAASSANGRRARRPSCEIFLVGLRAPAFCSHSYDCESSAAARVRLVPRDTPRCGVARRSTPMSSASGRATSFHRVHGAQERAAGLAAVLDLLGRQLRAADGARSGDGVVEGALFEVHAGTVARTRRGSARSAPRSHR